MTSDAALCLSPQTPGWAILHWPAEKLRARFTFHCETPRESVAEALLEKSGADDDIGAFRGRSNPIS
jgi:hypothetical protein